MIEQIIEWYTPSEKLPDNMADTLYTVDGNYVIWGYRDDTLFRDTSSPQLLN